MKIYIVAFGKLKTPGLRETADYYKKISRGWIESVEVELKPFPVSDKTPSTRLTIQKKESELLNKTIEKYLTPRGRLFLLDECGEQLSTEKWIGLFEKTRNSSVSEIIFCIGSSLGLPKSKTLSAMVTGRLGLGFQTISHELARVLLFEQVYRAFSVINGHPYHNAG
ncbi:MAG: hypothetical protein A3K03_04290 [Bdellovibrionales bacterium RIFOXYD1_FULL_44_7]|nr:MAG: hypothetical protein A3K03_04290 [Bdellovibrionales bacterium RIFOXYD1_FULL_44_7]